MARRGVKTVDRSVDLSAVLKTAEELPRPWNSEAVFGRVAPLELEIGSGKGLFLRSASDRFPEHDFIGIEIGRKYARFSASRLIGREQGNAILVCGDAAQVLRESIPSNLLEAVHVYFPDPWWKRAHKKRRILREDVLKLIERSITPGGSLHFWTDVEEYYLSTLELIAEKTDLQGPFEVPETVAEHDMDYHTHFERRTRIHGDAVYRARFQKK